MGTATDRLLAKASTPAAPVAAAPSAPVEEPKLSATERLLGLYKNLAPESSVTVPRETSLTVKFEPQPQLPPQDIRKPGVEFRNPFGDNVDVQRKASVLEQALSWLPAAGRGIAKSGGEALAGRNPFVQDAGRVPFVEGFRDPTYRGWTQVLEDQLPQWKPAKIGTIPGEPTPGALAAIRAVPTEQLKYSTPEELASEVPATAERQPDTEITTPSRDAVVWLGGLALNIGLDPVTYAGVGALTKAGLALRAAEVDAQVARMALAGAVDFNEAAAATRSLTEALDRVKSATAAVAAEGTAASRGRAALQVAGRTNPVMAAAPVMGAAETILGRLKQTQVGRGISEVFQPPTGRVDPALRGRSARVEAAWGIGKRDALRGMADLIDEYPDLYKAMGGDLKTLDDALALAYERSQGRRFDKPLDWLTDDERKRFWDTSSEDVRAQLQAEGARRASSSVDGYLNRADRARWRTAVRTVANQRRLAEGLGAEVSYSDQLGQKFLNARERSEMQRLVARRSVRENPFGPARARRGSGLALANPREEARIAQLEETAVARARAQNARSLAKLEATGKAARADALRLVGRAQVKSHAQALRNSILAARRMYYRGASPEAERAFGQYAEKLIARLNARNATVFSATAREGVKLAELADPLAYMLHATTPEAQKAILEAAVERGEITHAMGWREFTEKHGSQITRKLRMTATEANDLAARGELSITGGRKVKQFFYTNPLIAQTMREAGAAQAQGYARFLREAAYTYGKPARLAPKGWRAVPNEVEGIGDKILFEPEVADLLTRHHQALRDPAGVLDAYDRITQIWKAYTLGIFPVYHVRNELGDFWNAVVLGGLDPRYVGTAMDELLYGSKFAEKIGHKSRGLKTATQKFAPGALRDEAEALNVVQSAQIQQELERNVLGALAPRTSVRRTLKEEGLGAGLDMAQRKLTDNRMMEAAAAVGNAREQAFRLALYIDRRARGWSPEASAMWVKKHLIDYGQLSDTERNLVRRVLPFYTWTRHNAPLQLEYLFAKPGAFAAVQKGREAAAGDQPLGTGSTPLPSFLEEGLPIATGRSSEGAREFWRLEGTWPGSDALTALTPVIDPEKAAQRFLGLLHPMISEPLEQATGVDFWKTRPYKAVRIEDFPGEAGTFLGMPMPKRAIHALSNVRPLTELDRLNPGDVFGTDQVPGFTGNTREYPQIDQWQRWVNVLIGRGYSVDEARNAIDHARAYKRALQTIESDIKYAEQRGQTAKAASARRRYQYLLDHPEAVSPDMPK